MTLLKLYICWADWSNRPNLKRLVDEIGIEIRMAHYPAHTLKYSPIERRLFCHVTNACKGYRFQHY
ncbi:hypothetical protein FXW07_07970 [Methanosarcina sp. DH1]|nr:hypothetical protein [Methanosarcina sp. DH1]